MGFRNPIRVLDTEDTGAAIFETLRFRQGRIEAVSALAGNSMSLDPGAGAPTFTLSREDAPAGGKRNVARIGAAFLPIASAAPIVGPGPNPAGTGVLGPGWIQYDTAGYGTLTFRLLASGLVQFSGMLKNVFGATLSSGAVVVVAGSLPSWAWPTKSVITQNRASAVAPGVGHARVDVNPDGSLVMLESAVGNGQWLSLVGTYHPDNP